MFCGSCLGIWRSHDIWISKFEIKIWLSQEWENFSKWSKKYVSLFHKCTHSDLQNKLAKM